MKLSLIVPCYNEEKNVREFYKAVKNAFKEHIYDYEIVYVNDGSKDSTLNELKYLCNEVNDFIKIINFSRNFGKEAAIYAGLKESSGDYVAIIDSDLQQRPEIVVDMVRALDENVDLDCVAAYQKERKESKLLCFFKKEFYHLINKMSEIEFVSGASDFRTMRRNMVNAILSMPECFRFSKGLFAWVGFNTKFIPYQAEERANGETKWSFWKLFKYALEGIISFTTIPLRLATILGIGMSFLAILYMFIVIIQRLAFGIDVPGYATILILILVLGGVQLLTIGIMGEYIARTFTQSKNRPIYIAKEILSYKHKGNIKIVVEDKNEQETNNLSD